VSGRAACTAKKIESAVQVVVACFALLACSVLVLWIRKSQSGMT
jgi:hypothetical protein